MLGCLDLGHVISSFQAETSWMCYGMVGPFLSLSLCKATLHYPFYRWKILEQTLVNQFLALNAHVIEMAAAGMAIEIPEISYTHPST